jgi:hypothetical protein
MVLKQRVLLRCAFSCALPQSAEKGLEIRCSIRLSYAPATSILNSNPGFRSLHNAPRLSVEKTQSRAARAAPFTPFSWDSGLHPQIDKPVAHMLSSCCNSTDGELQLR